MFQFTDLFEARNRFLKTIKRTGLGVSLFAPLRYDSKTGEENPDFILNQGIYRKAKILVVAGGNFGCGRSALLARHCVGLFFDIHLTAHSSREHAPWALLDFGIRTVIASSFADM